MNENLQLSRLDTAFSQFLSQLTLLEKEKKQEFKSLCNKLSFYQSQGHNCIILDSTDQQLVQASGLISTNTSPIVLEQNRLYLHRYWFYEHRLAKQIKQLLTHTSTVNTSALISRYFVDLIDETDWQREAAIMAIAQSFCVITGGPGTGKTTTVVKIVAVLQEIAAQDNQSLHIALAAPTGKAAMRLQESLGSNKNSLPSSDTIKDKIPETVTTIHKLLGSRPPSPSFKHCADHPLSYDLVIVDEASMVDLALMSKLVDALKPASKLILLGDKNQLSSVESGAVLADLTAALPKQTVELIKSHRFKGKIKELADAVNDQLVDKAWKILEQGNQVSLLENNLINYACKQYSEYLQLIQDKEDLPNIFTAFNQFQILCTNRFGDNGIIEINQAITQKLSQLNKIVLRGQWYIGRPVMITQNNASSGLFNGDIGICLYDETTQKLLVNFLRSDGSIKKVLPSRIPYHETVFAMTIHKSQGSEFDECLCVLPDTVNPVLTKELLYTAITRAKTKLKLQGGYAIFKHTLQKKVVRMSGLCERLDSKSTDRY